ncbi:MAG: alpha/beta hydrolase [Calditrichota bacterium]
MKIIAIFFTLLLNSLCLYGNDFAIEDVEFTSHSVQLSGSIVFPLNEEIHSAVVFVHGSGEQTRSLYWAKKFAEAGIVTLVYDKRGVGKSGGKYEGNQSVSEKNINLLADDAIAALKFLRTYSRTKELPLGLTGISQAGWIVPLAAQKSQLADYIVIWSGPVCKVSEEDIYSKYTRDLDGERVPSYKEALEARKVKYVWPDFLGKDSNPSNNLANLNIPGLWIFGEKDGSVPVDLSIKRLNKLIDKGRDYEYVLFSKLGHNNMNETFATATNWIKRLKINQDLNFDQQ